MVENAFTTLSSHSFQVEVAFVLSVAWVAAEYFARRSTWLQGAPRRPASTMDRGTYPAIAVSIAIGMTATFFAFLSGVGGYLSLVWVPLGVLVVAVGLTVRVWALTTLGRFFTMPITIREDHQLVRGGPYRWLRHPSYTGGFLTAIGLPLALGTPAGFLVTLVACLIAYVYRIRIEEAALISKFGASYQEYSRRTWRLIPGVY